MSILKISDVYSYLLNYIKSSREKDSDKWLMFRDSSFSNAQIKIAKKFLKILDQLTARRSYVDFQDLAENIYLNIVGVLEELKELHLKAHAGDSSVTDGGFITTNSISTNMITFLKELDRGDAGTYLYQVFYFLKKQISTPNNTMDIDIGYYSRHGSLSDMSFFTSKKNVDLSIFEPNDDINPAITNNML